MEALQKRGADSLKGLVVGVVDESRAVSARIGELFTPLGCTLQVYGGPSTMIAESGSSRPDVIIIGYESCLDLIYAIRGTKILKAIPILVLVGRPEADLATAIVVAGADSLCTKSDVPELLVAKTIALIHKRMLNREIARLKEFTPIKTMIGTYKHELGNVLAIIDGKLKRLERVHPNLSADESLESIKRNLRRMELVLGKIAALKEYKEDE